MTHYFGVSVQEKRKAMLVVATDAYFLKAEGCCFSRIVATLMLLMPRQTFHAPLNKEHKSFPRR